MHVKRVKRKIHKTLILLLAVRENLTPPQLWAHANSMGRNPYVPCEYWTFIGQSKERETDFNVRETET